MRLLKHAAAFRWPSGTSVYRQTYFWLSAALCLFFVFVVPPFQKPDEVVHYLRTLSVARGNVICAQRDGIAQNYLPQYQVSFPAEQFVGGIAANQHAKYPWRLFIDSLSADTQLRDTTLVNEPSSCSLPFLPYLPAALVISIPSLLQVNPLVLFYLGRLTNCLLGIAIAWYAVKKTPRAIQLLPLTLFALPMSLFQLSSYSKDSLHLSMAILGFALFAEATEQKKSVTLTQGIVLSICLGLLVLARPQYALFLLLPLALKLRLPRTEHISAVAAAVGILFTASTILLVSLSLKIFADKAVSLQISSPAYVFPLQQVRHILVHPQMYLGVLSATIQDNFVFYGKGLIGILGWSDYELPWYSYLFYGGTLVAAFLSSKRASTVSSGKLVLIGGVIVGTVLSIFTSFYIFSAPLAATTIDGVQGRYFLAMIPLILWWLAAVMQTVRHKAIVFLSMLFTLAVGLTTIQRYYWYPEFYLRAELPFSLPDAQQLKAEKIIVSDAYSTMLAIDPDKKLTGVAFIPQENTLPTTTPYSIKILDPSCQILLREAIVSAPALIPNMFTQAITTPLPSATSKVCVKFEHYMVKPADASALSLATHQNTAILAPIYLR